MPIICALQLTFACSCVLALLRYDYNTIRNGSSIRANHYNYNPSVWDVACDHPAKFEHGNRLHEKLQWSAAFSSLAVPVKKSMPGHVRKNVKFEENSNMTTITVITQVRDVAIIRNPKRLHEKSQYVPVKLQLHFHSSYKSMLSHVKSKGKV